MAIALETAPQTQSIEPAGELVLASTMSPALQIMLNDRLFERAKQIAKYMSAAQGFMPPHLIGQSEACFAVVMRAITWKLDPYAVAQCTYQTPGGRVGFEGKLCQAVLENSGKLQGPVTYEFYGDWSNVTGKFAIKENAQGKKYAYPTWTREDAKGLGVIVRAQVRGEVHPREWNFDLAQAFPLNSTLWATDPKTQICYAAVRRFANVAAPGLFMGVPFDRSDLDDDGMRDITPAPRRPTRVEFDPKPEPKLDAPPATDEQVKAAERAMYGTTEDPPHDEDGVVEELPPVPPPSAATSPSSVWLTDPRPIPGAPKPKQVDVLIWAREFGEHVKKSPSLTALNECLDRNSANLKWFRARFATEGDTLQEIIDQKLAELSQ